MHINLLRSFYPQPVHFGSNEAMDNEEWIIVSEELRYTWFKTKDQYIVVIYSYNPYWNCFELSFKTVLQSKVVGKSFEEMQQHVCYLPDIDMPIDPNRATDVFRKVTFIASSQFNKYDKVGFTGATEYLDRVYTRLARLQYAKTMLKQFGMSIYQDNQDIFFYKY